jgi:hypothetical protein
MVTLLSETVRFILRLTCLNSRRLNGNIVTVIPLLVANGIHSAFVKHVGYI